MNKKEELKSIIDSLNNFMGKIDSVDEPKPTTDFTTGNNAFKHLQQPKYPEGILSFKTCYDQIVSFKNQVGNYQNWCNGHLGKERENILPSAIHSVKNSKGEIFTVGDTVTNIVAGGRVCKIESFFVSNDGIRASYEGLPSTNIHIDGMVKAEPKKEPLLTEDGFEYEIGEDHEKWCLYGISKDDFSLDYFFAGDSPTEYWYFKEKHNAERFITENKKSISYKELEKFLDTNYVGAGFLYEDIDSRRRFRAEILNHFTTKQ